MNHPGYSSTIVWCLALLCSAGAATAQMRFTEDFTTTTFKDTINTTAEWSTADGELRLYTFAPEQVGSVDTPGTGIEVRVAGDRAYLADGDAGLQIIDISAPDAPALVGGVDTPGTAHDVFVSGDRAYVADGEAGLQIIDISDPSQPALLGGYDTSGVARGVFVSGDHAYVADGVDGLLVVYVAESALPVPFGSLDMPGDARVVFVSGNRAYVADYDAGLQVIDVSNPGLPTQLGNLDTAGWSQEIRVAGERAFLADGYWGLQVIDISEPTMPALLATHNTDGYAHSLVVYGDRVCLADGDEGLLVIDISDPANPVTKGTYDSPGVARGVVVAGPYAYVADDASGLHVVEVADPVGPRYVGEGDCDGVGYGVCVHGDLAYVASGTQSITLAVFDISDPASPLLVGSCWTQGDGQDVQVAGRYAYVADGFEGLRVIDVSEPTLPVPVALCDTPGYARAVSVSGNFVYVADGDAGLCVVNVSDPATPVLEVCLDVTGDAQDVFAAGDIVFVAADVYGLHVIDITLPWLPLLSGTCNTPDAATAVCVSGNYAYVADRNSGLQVVDVTDPSSPTLAGGVYTGYSAYGVCVSGDRAVVTGSSFFQVIDITNPAAPVSDVVHWVLGWGWNVQAAGHHVLRVSSSAVLQVYEILQDEVDTKRNIGKSLAIDGIADIAICARLVPTHTGSVNWYLSADDGINWQAAYAGNMWIQFDHPGSQLRWSSTHRWVSGINPTVSQLDLEWLREFAPIVSVGDVPDDQGGWVRISIDRSGYDSPDETGSPVTGYQVYQRVDAAVADVPAPDAALCRPDDATASGVAIPEGVSVWSSGDHVFARARDKAGTFPEGTWEVVGWIAATQTDTYTARVPTTADSTAAAVNWSTYLVTTHTTVPSVWFTCQPDSGYSVDNLAPGVPQNIAAGYQSGGVALDWDDAPESDFQFYRIYRGEDPGFMPVPDNLLQEVAVSHWTDPVTAPWGFYYKVTTLDHAGNESEGGSPVTTTRTDPDDLPTQSTLHEAVPNPFNPSTRLAFGLAASGWARLVIYDAAGHLVATLVDDHLSMGRHEVMWNGRDDAGRAASSGIYLYRLEADGGVLSRRMVLLK